MANQITTLGNREESLSEQYDAANVTLGNDRKAVAAANKALAAADASTAKAKAVLTKEAVNAYIHDGTAGTSAIRTTSLKNANSSLLRAEYTSSLAATETDAQDAFRLATVQDKAAKQNLEAAQASAQNQMNTLAADRAQVTASQNRLEGVYHQETSQIATLVTQIQTQQQAAAQAAANARVAAQQRSAGQTAQTQQAPPTSGAQAAAAVSPETSGASAATDASPAETSTTGAPTTSSSSDTTGATTTSSTQAPATTAAPAASSPPASGVGAGAVAAAETQVGVPYEWGGATPGVGFDCSGLVMWAYAQVGVSLPHFSGGQFDAGVQIPMSDLEPGDLVFFADPGDHVAIYVGGGDIIEAPTFGQTVHVVPMYSEFVQAVRIT